MTNEIDIVERLRSSAPLPLCPFEKRSPEYWTTPNDKPCKFCGGLPEGPDKCTGADMRILLEAADEIERLRVSPAVLVNVCVKPDGSVDLIPHPGVVSVTQPASMAVVECERQRQEEQSRSFAQDKLRIRQIAALEAERDDLLKVIDANWVQHQRVVALRKALERIIDLDHHNMGSESQATKIARAALQAEAKHA